MTLFEGHDVVRVSAVFFAPAHTAASLGARAVAGFAAGADLARGREGRVDLKAFAEQHPEYRVLAPDPLVLDVGGGALAVLTKFGAAILWNAPDDVVERFHDEVAAHGHARVDRVRDTLLVRIGGPEQAATFNELRVPELTLERLRLVSLGLGQSVALEHFELEVHRVIQELGPRVDTLRTAGRLVGAERAILSEIGFALTVRAEVLANLALLDKPAEAWVSESIDRLDALLWDFFELDERIAAVTKKVDYLADVGQTFLGVLTHRKSLRLEWVVVLLIVFEVLMGLYEHFGLTLH